MSDSISFFGLFFFFFFLVQEDLKGFHRSLQKVYLLVEINDEDYT